MVFSLHKRFWVSSSFLLLFWALSVSSLTPTFISGKCFYFKLDFGFLVFDFLSFGEPNSFLTSFCVNLHLGFFLFFADHVFDSQAHAGRNLLQAKKGLAFFLWLYLRFLLDLPIIKLWEKGREKPQCIILLVILTDSTYILCSVTCLFFINTKTLPFCLYSLKHSSLVLSN